MPPSKFRIFIGSSRESLEVARAVRAELADDYSITLWTDIDAFALGNTTIESLEKATTTNDFAILILEGNDIVQSRGDESVMPRDNVLFELGMFMGALSRQRVFGLHPSGVRLRLPSDLAGMKLALYTESEGRPAVGAACDLVRRGIEGAGGLDALRVPGEVEQLSTNLSKAALIENDAFKHELRRKLAEWVRESVEWRRGEVYVRRSYEIFLAEVYRGAQRNIFSTSIPDYNTFWKQDLGRALLDIQASNDSASSTRLFVFESKLEVDDSVRSILADQLEHGVEAYCYFNREDTTYDFSPDTGKDWTVVDDGDVIGVTHDLGGPSAEVAATWYFGDQGRKDFFAEQRDRLLRVCTFYHWKARPDGTLECDG
jgi:hypothetical protein